MTEQNATTAEEPRSWQGGLIEGDEIAKQHGVELEPEDEFPQRRFVVNRRVVNPEPAPVPSLEAQLDAQATDAKNLVVQREAEHAEAEARLARAELARVDAPRDPATLVELEAAERATHVAALDVKAAQRARDKIVARVDKTKAEGKLAELQSLVDKQTDEAVIQLCERFAQRADDAAKQLGLAVVDGIAAMKQVMADRAAAEVLARHLEIGGWRPGRLDQGFLIQKIGAAFAKGFTAASKLPHHAVSRWTGG